MSQVPNSTRSSGISSDCHCATKNLKVRNKNPRDEVPRRVVMANSQTERTPATQAQFRVGTVGTSNPLHCVLTNNTGTGNASNPVANGHANHTPGGTAGVQTNGTSKGQNPSRVNGK